MMQNGGRFAEIYLERSEGRAIRFDNRQLDTITQGLDQGVGLRLVVDDKTFFANGNALDEASLLTLAESLSRAARVDQRQEDPVAFGRTSHPEVNPVSIDPRTVPLKAKIDLVTEADALMRSVDKRIVQATALYRESVRFIEIFNSEGMAEQEERYQCAFVCSAVAADSQGNIQTGTEVRGGALGYELFSGATVKEAAQEAARIALLQLEAEPAPAGTFMVVLHSEAGGTMIHEAVGHGLEGDFNAKELSVYSGKMGSMVASPLITVVDDGTLANKRGSEKMDDEGNPARKNILIENGKLVGYLHDRKSARHFQVGATGNGRRESYRHLPQPRMRNTYIAPGNDAPDKIINSVQKGILVKKMGGGQVDIVNGNFVFNVSEGYMIENGKVGKAIRGATLTGNGPKVMQIIDMVGSDLGFGIGTCGKGGQGVPVSDAQPTIRIPEIVVGGIVG